MSATTLPFSLTIEPDGALLVSGEIDMGAADAFLNAAVAMADPSREVVLDVAGLTFIDSAGLRAIMRLAMEACPHGIVLQSPREALLRVLEVVEIEEFAGIRVERERQGIS